MNRRCFLFGHRDAPAAIVPELEAAIEKLIVENGVTEFLVGAYGSFDRLAARVLAQAQKRHPEILLVLLLFYHPQERPVKKPEEFIDTFYPPGMERVPRRYAIARANRYALEHSDYLIAYVWQAASHARDLLDYARRREKRGLLTVTLIGREKR